MLKTLKNNNNNKNKPTNKTNQTKPNNKNKPQNQGNARQEKEVRKYNYSESYLAPGPLISGRHQKSTTQITYFIPKLLSQVSFSALVVQILIWGSTFQAYRPTI